MASFVDKDSIVRRIWGKSDTVLFIFAGASAEFALNKAVDWLYFTGRLPHDPIGRLFSTVAYARQILFSEEQTALRTIDAMSAIHTGVEAKRGMDIPDWAYRDVLFMLIYYSIRSYEVLERDLTSAEKIEVLRVFNKVGSRMGLSGLPETFESWEKMRSEHLIQHIQRSDYTDNLFRQYRRHLGPLRYPILLEVQSLIVPARVGRLLGLSRISMLYPLLAFYKLSRSIKADRSLRDLLLPSKYKKQINAIDEDTGTTIPKSRDRKSMSCPFSSLLKS